MTKNIPQKSTTMRKDNMRLFDFPYVSPVYAGLTELVNASLALPSIQGSYDGHDHGD